MITYLYNAIGELIQGDENMGIQLWDTISAKANLIKSDINVKLRSTNDIYDKLGVNPLGFKKGPGFIEKVDMLFTDVETEGKKQGYDKASKEYGHVFKELENTYKETKILIVEQKNMYQNQSDKLIDRLAALEYERDCLQVQVDSKAKQLAKEYNIPIEKVTSEISSGTLLMTDISFGILDIIYSHKEKKLKKAEQKGYLEAKELYEEKINKLKVELNLLKEKGHGEIKELVDLISDVLDEIVENQMKIAELRILI